MNEKRSVLDDIRDMLKFPSNEAEAAVESVGKILGVLFLILFYPVSHLIQPLPSNIRFSIAVASFVVFLIILFYVVIETLALIF